MTDEFEKPLLSVKAVAERLDVAPATIYKWANKNLIDHYRLGINKKTLRFKEEHIEKFLGDECATISAQTGLDSTRSDGQKTHKVNPALSVLKTKSWQKSA